MSFFEPPPPLPDDRPHDVPPPWFQPPDDVLAALVPDRLILAQSGPVVLLLSHIDAYPTGCRIHVRVVASRTDAMDEDDWWDLHDLMFEQPHGRRRRSGLPDELLRFGVQYADGTKATTTGSPWIPDMEQPPDGPVLSDHHGGSGGGTDRQIVVNRPLWLWPLPPAEPFDLVFEWPAFGFGLTRVVLDGSAINDASRRCRPLFEAREA